MIVHVWKIFILGRDPSEISQEVEQLAELIEMAGSRYILWALSTGMQASANLLISWRLRLEIGIR